MRIPRGPAVILLVPLTCIPPYLVYLGLLDFYSVDTSFDSVLVCPNILSVLHVRKLVKRADERLHVCLFGRVSTLFSWAPTARVCVKFDIVESLKPAEKIGNLVTVAKILGTYHEDLSMVYRFWRQLP